MFPRSSPHLEAFYPGFSAEDMAKSFVERVVHQGANAFRIPSLRSSKGDPRLFDSTFTEIEAEETVGEVLQHLDGGRTVYAAFDEDVIDALEEIARPTKRRLVEPLIDAGTYGVACEWGVGSGVWAKDAQVTVAGAERSAVCSQQADLASSANLQARARMCP